MVQGSTGQGKESQPMSVKKASGQLFGIFDGDLLELKSDAPEKTIKEKTLADGYSLTIQAEKEKGEISNFIVSTTCGRERYVDFAIDTDGTSYLCLYGVVIRVGSWPTTTTFPTYRFSREDIKDKRFIETIGLLVNWVKQMVNTDQFIQPPVRVEVLGY